MKLLNTFYSLKSVLTIVFLITCLGVSSLPGSTGNAETLNDDSHALTVKAIHSAAKGDYDSAIRYFKSALKLRPDDRGIRIALGHVMYTKDKEEGNIQPNPKVEVLLDALQYGKGDWKVSIRYLEDALSVEQDKDKLMAIRDALNITRGIYEDIDDEQEMLDLLFDENMPESLTMRIISDGFRNMDEGDYDAAVENFKIAHKRNPHDMRVKEILNYAEGRLYARYRQIRSWAEQKQVEYGDLMNTVRTREAAAQNALEQSKDALDLSIELEDDEAASISRRAIMIARNALEKVQAFLQTLEARLQAAENMHKTAAKGHRASASVIRGDVLRKTDSGWVAFDGKSPLVAGDEVRTGADGFAEFVFTDNTTAQIGPDSTLIITRISEKSSTYELLKGRFHAEMACLKQSRKPCREIHVGSGFTVAVRGTELAIDRYPDKPTTITVIDGTIEVVDRSSGKNIEVAGGEQLVIEVDGAIEEPVSIKPNSLKHWWEDMQ